MAYDKTNWQNKQGFQFQCYFVVKGLQNICIIIAGATYKYDPKRDVYIYIIALGPCLVYKTKL